MDYGHALCCILLLLADDGILRAYICTFFLIIFISYTSLQASSKPWYKANFFISEPVLFGTWDGVFTSCMINIFGVVIFLRTGWIVVSDIASSPSSLLFLYCVSSFRNYCYFYQSH
jgi:hypothetical protein